MFNLFWKILYSEIRIKQRFFGVGNLLLVLFFIQHSLTFSQGNPCINTSIGVSPVVSQLACEGTTDIQMASSEIGVNYYLRDDSNNAILSGPLAGTGGALAFSTGQITSTTSYNVFGVKQSGGLQFDGVDDYAQIPGLTNLGGSAITIEYWFKGTQIQSAVRYQGDPNNYIVTGWNGIRHILSNDGGTNGGVLVGSNAQDGQWHHVAMTWEINTFNGFKSYLDGQLIQQRNSSAIPIPDLSYNLLLGSYMGSGEFTNGTIDEVRIWSVARTQTEIQASMNNCLVAPFPGLLAYYKFEEGSGSTSFADASGNGYTGNTINMNTTMSWVFGVEACSGCSEELTATATVNVQQIFDLPVSATQLSLCESNSGTTISVSSSQTGIKYYLRDDTNDTIVDGPLIGNGGALVFNTGPLTESMNYNVYAEHTSVPPFGSLYFDGIGGINGDRVAVGGANDFQFHGTTPFTFEFWFNADYNIGYLFSKFDIVNGIGYFCLLQSNGFRFYINDGSSYMNIGNSAGLVTMNTWHHLAVSYDGSQSTAGFTIYLDGAPIAKDINDQAGTVQPFASTGIPYIGFRPVTNTFWGSIGETRVWNVARTPAEIAANYTSCLYGSEPGLIAYYDYRDGTGSSTLTDLSPSGLDGTLISMDAGAAWVAGPPLSCTTVLCSEEMTEQVYVTVGQSTTSSTTVSECTSYNWNGNTYNTSGTYTWNGTNVEGCDSTATLNLTILTPTTSTTTVSGCDSYTWNGTTYSTTGSYTWNGTNIAGCDSTATLNLTILNPTTSVTTVSECDSYSWNGTTYTTTGSYAWNGTNVAGCDSTATLNLTILTPTTSTTTVSECDAYTWNGTTYTTTGSYTWNGTNAAGCDSIATLNLSIITLDASVTDNSPTLAANLSGANYQWIDCGNNNSPIIGETGQSFTASVNGDYAVIVTANNCVDTSQCVNVNNLGVGDLFSSRVLSVYPNPFGNEFQVELSPLENEVSIEIYAADGRLIATYSRHNSSFTVDASNWERGVYYLSVLDKEDRQIIQLVKQ